MDTVRILKKEIVEGKLINREEALLLVDQPLEELCTAANEIREYFCGNSFDICSIVNAKSGLCSEDCKFCAQSASYNTDPSKFHPLDEKRIMELAEYNLGEGVSRYSIVTSGKKLSADEIDKICKIIETLKEKASIRICASLGLLNESQFQKLKRAGVSRIHNNLETSRGYFKKICTTHTYDDKINSINNAKNAGFEVCSGGIMGLGESMEDRIDMAIAIRELGIHSVPVNILNPIPGTPLENNKILSYDEIRRIIAIYRFLLPDALIRLAGGRGLMPDKGAKCFQSGSNAAISGHMLTINGIDINQDMKILKELGYGISS